MVTSPPRHRHRSHDLDRLGPARGLTRDLGTTFKFTTRVPKSPYITGSRAHQTSLRTRQQCLGSVCIWVRRPLREGLAASNCSQNNGFLWAGLMANGFAAPEKVLKLQSSKKSCLCIGARLCHWIGISVQVINDPARSIRCPELQTVRNNGDTGRRCGAPHQWRGTWKYFDHLPDG